jgi:hypothetical protein
VLQNIVERSVILCTGDTFGIDEAWLSSQNASRRALSHLLTENLHNYEKELIEAALAESNGIVAGPNGAAAKLGIPRSTLDLKIKQLNIRKAHHPVRPLVELPESWRTPNIPSLQISLQALFSLRSNWALGCTTRRRCSDGRHRVHDSRDRELVNWTDR